MPTRNEQSFDRIHERIDALIGGVNELKVTVERNIAHCDPCRKVVMGNGKESISERIKALETTRGVSKWWITAIITASSVCATIFSAVVHYAVKGSGGQ
jgi:hypothetical protein